MNSHQLQLIIDSLEGQVTSLKLIADSKVVCDLESTEGFQDLTDHRMSGLILNLKAYVRAVRHAKEEIENPPDSSEFNDALSQVFGGLL